VKISVISPAYLSANCIDELCERLIATLQKMTPDFEIILIDDGSPDQSWKMIEQRARQNSKIKGIRLNRNFGQHNAITAGLDIATGDWIVVMDCDLQDRPEEIPRLYQAAIDADVDIAIASRRIHYDSVFKKWNSKIFYWIFNLLTDHYYDGSVGNFRILSSSALLDIRKMTEQIRFFAGQCDWLGFSSVQVPVEHARGKRGRSSYTFIKLIRLAGNWILAYSNTLLSFAIKFGLCISGTAILYGVYSFFRALIYGSSVTGWSSLFVSIYLLGGITIFFLGILGLYIGKIFDEVRRRPIYVVRKSVNIAPGPSDIRSSI
jgi:glycosyltransferase involved in cell wall biosynthesis